jgi:hypothetical protein
VTGRQKVFVRRIRLSDPVPILFVAKRRATIGSLCIGVSG